MVAYYLFNKLLMYLSCWQMKWADRAQQAANVARAGKNFLLGRAGLVFAVVMLVVAMFLHYMGVIGG